MQLRNYESVVILKSDTPEERQKNLFQKNESIINSYEGKVNHVDCWGSRTLANPIEKSRRGIYFHSTFTGDPKVVAELERTMGINEDVLRFMHTRLEDDVEIGTQVEKFKDLLKDSVRREKERELKKERRVK